MNYLAPTYAVSLFPWTTFVDRATLIAQDTSHDGPNRRWMDKYRKRGFAIVGAGDRIPASRELRAWERRVGDKFTWVMPYDVGKLRKWRRVFKRTMTLTL